MKQKIQVLFIFNPVAGDRDKTDLIDDVILKAADFNHSLRIYETTGKDDDKAIKAILDKEPFERVLVAGGDGTINLVAGIIKGTSCVLGILPAGSANGLAVNFGIPLTLDEQLEIALGDTVIDVDLLWINDHLSIHIADVGMNAALIEKYEKSSIRGKVGYFLQTIPTLFTTEYPCNFEIEINGKKIEREGIVLAFANANKFGTGATVNPKGIINDGKFELLIFHNLSVVEIYKSLNDALEMSSDFVEVISTTKATIYIRKPIPFQIDGEYMGKVTKVEASVLPEKLKMAVPVDFQIQQNLAHLGTS